MPNPTRIHIDTHGVLWPQDGPYYGYGGDPTVIKFEGENGRHGYVMYFTGLHHAAPSWGQVFRAVSSDGINWDLDPLSPVVPADDGGVLGYGSGAPSVVYKDGTYFLYYYTQWEKANGTTSPGVYRRTSSDGVNFSMESRVKVNIDTALDVKFVDSLGKWIAVYYWHRIWDVCNDLDGISFAISDDGINFTYDPNNQIAQDDPMCLCHNPGMIGDRLGHGLQDMYVTFGASEKPISNTEYYTRQLEYSSLHVTPW